jgi:hypothetical protein
MFYNQDTGNPRFDLARNLAGRVRFNPPDPLFPNMTWQTPWPARRGMAQVPMPYALPTNTTGDAVHPGVPAERTAIGRTWSEAAGWADQPSSGIPARGQ